MLALGADHASWQLEEEIKARLLERNAERLDFGTHDYPLEIVEMWRRVEFQGERHARRLGKIAELEQRHAQAREA